MINPLKIATHGLLSGINTLTAAVQGFLFTPSSGQIGQDVMNSGGNWRHHVPSWVWREQEEERKRTQQRRNAAILALSL